MAPIVLMLVAFVLSLILTLFVLVLAARASYRRHRYRQR